MRWCWGAADEYDQIFVIVREFVASIPAVNSTWDHVMCCLSLPLLLVGTPSWACVAASALCCSGHFARAAASQCPCGSMGPCILTFGGGLIFVTSAQWWLRRQTGSGSSAGRWADWARFVELTVLLQGWSLVRRAPGDAALRS